MHRRTALRIAGAALAAGLGTASAQPGEDMAPPKGPKIGPPPEPGETAEEDLCAPRMIGLTLRVIRPGQMVTMEYDQRRLTVTIDKDSVITDIRIG